MMRNRIKLIGVLLASIVALCSWATSVTAANETDRALQLLLADDGLPDIEILVRATASGGKWMFAVEDVRSTTAPSQELQAATAIPPNNDLVLPIGAVVQISVTSSDAIYPFLIPDLGIATSAVPGRIEQLIFKPTKAGAFPSSCDADCDPKWTEIGFRVQFVSQSVFEAWMSKRKK